MLPNRGDYRKAQRRLATAVELVPASADAVVETFLTTVADVLNLDSGCWHRTDPASGAPVSAAEFGDAPGSEAEAMQYEFQRPDVNRFTDLRCHPTGVASIWLATGERPSRSRRFREMIEPAGVRDELRIAFKDTFGIWAVVVAFTRRHMTDDDVRFVLEVAPVVTDALRRTSASEWRANPDGVAAQTDGSGPSVLILNAHDHVLSADAIARQRLELLPVYRPAQVPGVIAYVAARARWEVATTSASTRMRMPDGRWLLLDASAMDDAAGTVAVVMQPASPSSVLDHVLRSYGLSVRERQVAALLARGHSAKSIAAELIISPWTVQDHIKAIYRKTGVAARPDLSALAGVRSA